jgi:hypothetical protein
MRSGHGLEGAKALNEECKFIIALSARVRAVTAGAWGPKPRCTCLRR